MVSEVEVVAQLHRRGREALSSAFLLDAPSLDTRLEHFTAQGEVHSALRSFARAPVGDGLALHLLHLERLGMKRQKLQAVRFCRFSAKLRDELA